MSGGKKRCDEPGVHRQWAKVAITYQACADHASILSRNVHIEDANASLLGKEHMRAWSTDCTGSVHAEMCACTTLLFSHMLQVSSDTFSTALMLGCDNLGVERRARFAGRTALSLVCLSSHASLSIRLHSLSIRLQFLSKMPPTDINSASFFSV